MDLTIAKANLLISEGKQWQAENLLFQEGIIDSKETEAIVLKMVKRLDEAYERRYPTTNGDPKLVKTRDGNTYIRKCLTVFEEHPDFLPVRVSEIVGCSIDQAVRAKGRFDVGRKRSQRRVL